MTELRTIDIDIDIHKKIEAERRSFTEPPREALRRLLNLPTIKSATPPSRKPGGDRSWSGEGVTLPHGTKLRMEYNGRQHEGEVVDGEWLIDGKRFDSPSGAAGGVALTKKGRKTHLDGWLYWQVLLPGETTWTSIAALRQKVNGKRELTPEDFDL